MEFRLYYLIQLFAAAILILGVQIWVANISVGYAQAAVSNPPSQVCDPDDHEGHDHDAESEEDHDAEEAGHDDHEGHDHDADVEEDHDVEEADPDDHDHGAHAGEGLRITEEQRKRFGVEVRRAESGVLSGEILLPGEVVFNKDHVVHMVPRVPGIVREVAASVGENLKNGDLLAVIDSRELADAKSKYLAAKARSILAETKFQRESALREKQISSEQDYLDIEQALAEAKIELRSSEQQLHALGLSEDAVRMLDGEHGVAITRYEVRSPIDGIVTEKHISLGESLEGTADIFTLVDMSSVWINLTVYTKNLSAVRNGTEVQVLTEYGVQGHGEISMVTPFVEESTRTATARVVMDNSDGSWIPGTFVTGSIGVSAEGVTVVVPKDAVQSIDGESVVFVEEDGAFAPTPVETGRSDRTRVEIVAGLRPGVRYAARGAFELKATIITSTFDAHAGHGH